MGNKLIGGEFLFTPGNSRNNVMRGNLAEKSVANALLNSATSISRTDTSGIAISPEGIYGLVGSTVTPFLRVVDLAAEAWVTPIVSLPGSRPDEIMFSASGSEFAVGVASAPYLLRYSYPGFVQQLGPAVPPIAGVIACSYGGGDTKLALAINASPWIEVYNVATMTKASFTPAVSAPAAALSDIAMNPAGTLLATSGTPTSSQGVRVWNYPAGTSALIDTSTDNYAIEFSPNGARLASLHVVGSRYIRIYNTSTWAFVDISSTGQPYGISAPRSLRWIGNNHVFVSNEYSCAIHNVVTRACVAYTEWGFSSSVGQAYPSPLSVPRKLAGNVTDAASNPVARVVRAYHSATGDFIGETTSNGTTGDFEMLIFTSEPVTVFAIGSGGENAKIYNPVTPAAWP